MGGCPFCEIVEGLRYVSIVGEWPQVIAAYPDNPIVPGHVIFFPRHHVADFTSSLLETASVMASVADIAQAIDGPLSVITAKVADEDTAREVHFRVHLIPRHHGDNLGIPWYDEHTVWWNSW